MKATTKEEAEKAWMRDLNIECVARFARGGRGIDIAKNNFMLGATRYIERYKSALRAEIEDRLKLLFLAIEDGGKEYYPFDSMSEENLIGMKRAYQDLFGIIETTLPPKE